MDLRDRKMVTNTNLKYADSSLNYYVIINVQKFLKNFKLENFQKISHSRGMKCQPKANNNRFAVVACATHVVKRPSKRMRASIYTHIYTKPGIGNLYKSKSHFWT